MERFAWKAIIKDGKLAEYKKRHDNIWPEMKQVLKEAGIKNYTIWNVGNEVLAISNAKKALPMLKNIRRKVQSWINGTNT